MKTGNLTRFILFILAGTEVRAAAPTTPVPPAEYVMPGRTYNPSEPLTPPLGGANKIYVSITGSNSNPGTAAQPYKTIQYALDHISSGYTVVVSPGFYRERLSLSNKDNVTVTSDGTGEVIIDASDAVTGWTTYDAANNIYQANPGFAVGNVVVNNLPLYRETALSGLTGVPSVSGVPVDQRYFYDSGSGVLYVRYATPPSDWDIGVLKDGRGNGGFSLYACNNLTLYGLTFRFAQDGGVGGEGLMNFRVERCAIVFNGHTGLTVMSIGDGARFIKDYVYFNMMLNWPRGRWPYGGWGTGIGLQGVANGLVDGCISQKNGGEGILTYDNATGGTKFTNNVSVDNWSVNFYYDNMPNGTIEGNLSVGHTPSGVDNYNSGAPADWVDKSFRSQRPVGIMVANEPYNPYTLNNCKLNNIMIRNNVIINTAAGFGFNAEGNGVCNPYPQSGNPGATASGIKNITYVNNTIVVPAVQESHEYGLVGIDMPYNNGNNTGSYFQNNVLIGGISSAIGMRSVAAGGFSMSNPFLGLTVDHNLVYMPSSGAPFDWGDNWGTGYSFANWHNTVANPAGQGLGDLNSNPQLTNAATDVAVDKKPLAGSPAIDHGTAIPAFVTTDFLGIARPQGTGWDMGAFEQAGGPPDTMPPARPKGVRFQ